MRLPWRRDQVPDVVRAAIQLQPGERVLASSRGRGDTYLVATDHALHVVTGVGPDAGKSDPGATARRLRWDLIDRARWEPPLLHLEVRADEAAPVVPEQVEADPAGDVPAVVRDRVTNSILVNSRIDVVGGFARVVARRNADTGALQWRVVVGPGVDPSDPAVQEAAHREMADLRSRLGV